ncbi:NAD(P)-dependent oxidoreductase [Actibacterium sp. MT2.3-13A]|uniref:NAD(P)-dependent oxidoreductase n=1 Tax=Actibacterium sp. MT2.3-13A TaxID=2828332 RepID=UPI001BAA9EE8|nr:NAD(P)-dependent oxidoreductase [Actibacterium sp. MT2.3-13A]
MRTVFLTEPIHADAETLLAGAGWQIARGWQLSDGARARAMSGADAWLVRIAPLSAGTIEQAPGLRIISKHGVGVDNIDLAAAAARGVAVSNTPGANAQPVAEHTMMMLLALTRQACAMDRVARNGFAGIETLAPVDLAGRRVLVAGFGAIGRRVAALCAAFGMQVTVWHRSLDAAEAGFPVVRDLRAALPRAEVLSLHLPLVPGTRGLIGAGELALLPAGAFVLNTGRGGIIDEDALVQAAPRLGGIGLDVFETEPLPADSPLAQLDNALLTPHAGAMSPAGYRQMGLMAAQNILDHFAGRLAPAHRVR